MSWMGDPPYNSDADPGYQDREDEPHVHEWELGPTPDSIACRVCRIMRPAA